MKKWVYFFLFLIFSTCIWAASPFQAFLLGSLHPIHPLFIQNQVYLPLKEVASLFHLKATVDLKSNQIVFDQETPLDPPATSSSLSTNPNDVILGKIMTSVDNNIEKPALHVKITLFKTNEKYDEEIDRHAIRLWILKNEPFYADTHGKVAETTSDTQGHFAFSKIPPGSYELVAVLPISSHEIGYWFTRVRLNKDEPLEINLDSQTLELLQLK